MPFEFQLGIGCRPRCSPPQDHAKTVQSWEQGVRTPSHASRRLIQIYSQHPETVCESVGMTPITLQGVTIEKVAHGQRRIVVQGAATRKGHTDSSRRSSRTRPKVTR